MSRNSRGYDICLCPGMDFILSGLNLIQNSLCKEGKYIFQTCQCSA